MLETTEKEYRKMFLENGLGNNFYMIASAQATKAKISKGDIQMTNR